MINKQYFRWQLQKINEESLENTKINLTKIIKPVANIPLQEILNDNKNSESLKSIELFIVTLEYVNVKDIKEILIENNISIN